MNVFLWILQAFLALLNLSGGAYKAFAFAELAKQMTALPHGAWRALGVLEMVCGVLLIVPAATKWMPVLTPVAAAVLALEALGLAVVYSRYSLAVTPSNPLTWSVVIALVAAFVAYGRFVLKPLV